MGLSRFYRCIRLIQRVAKIQLPKLSRLHYPCSCGRGQPVVQRRGCVALAGVGDGVRRRVRRMWWSATGYVLSELTD